MTLGGAVYESSAPGRMDVMGGIADYSGSLVLQMAIERKTNVKVKVHSDRIFRVTSDNSGGETLYAEIPFDAVLNDGNVDYAFASEHFKLNKSIHWSSYVVGCALVIQKEKGITIGGADFEIRSDVPIGKGVSSSASLEVATMKALATAFDVTFNGTELPVLAQRVENLIVGAPCGLMDQLTSYFGDRKRLLPIVCQPDRIMTPLSLPAEIHFVGIDSGIRHSVGGASYGEVRCAAFMGYTMIAHSLGVSRTDIDYALTTGDRSALPYGGYLCNLTVHDFERKFASILPGKISGEDFMRKYGSTIDPLSIVKPSSLYSVLNCTAHAVYENERVQKFKSILESPDPFDHSLMELGELMYASHESYSRCGLGAERTDEIVRKARQFLQHGIYGAKITGGGSGGTVCLLGHGDKGLHYARTLHGELCEEFKTNLEFIE